MNQCDGAGGQRADSSRQRRFNCAAVPYHSSLAEYHFQHHKCFCTHTRQHYKSEARPRSRVIFVSQCRVVFSSAAALTPYSKQTQRCPNQTRWHCSMALAAAAAVDACTSNASDAAAHRGRCGSCSGAQGPAPQPLRLQRRPMR